jgi:hypothetical protein
MFSTYGKSQLIFLLFPREKSRDVAALGRRLAGAGFPVCLNCDRICSKREEATKFPQTLRIVKTVSLDNERRTSEVYCIIAV